LKCSLSKFNDNSRQQTGEKNLNYFAHRTVSKNEHNFTDNKANNQNESENLIVISSFIPNYW